MSFLSPLLLQLLTIMEWECGSEFIISLVDWCGVLIILNTLCTSTVDNSRHVQKDHHTAKNLGTAKKYNKYDCN